MFGCLIAASMASGSARATESPRSEVRFDSDWRFNRGDLPAASSANFDDSRWRHVDLPHDFSIEDLPPVETHAENTIDLSRGTWHFKLGDNPTWSQVGLNDTNWINVVTPSFWSKTTGALDEYQFGWYRRILNVPASRRAKDIVLALGEIDDADQTFVNGVLVGSQGTMPPNYKTSYDTQRVYTVPHKLLKYDGTDTVAVRVYNGGAQGGMWAASVPIRRDGPFDSRSPNGTAQGFTLGDVAWYRKDFKLPNSARGRNLMVTFDGVYMNSTVWFNGHQVATQPYGYTTFNIDLTPYARVGGDNALAVRVDTTGRTSRWYSGSGIYRHVWLTTTNAAHIAPWGIAATSHHDTNGNVTVRAAVQLASVVPASARVAVALIDPSGKTVQSAYAKPNADGLAACDLAVDSAKLWSPKHPNLYELVCTLSENGKVVDRETTNIGIRFATFSATDGFRLNGESMKLMGGCVHHDNGPLGSAAYDRAEERRVQLLKASGFNAIRTSHNPPSPAFLDACDREGILVIDEAFDCWSQGKNSDDYGKYFAANWKHDLDSMVLRDRNHPSVILWSIGNEIPEQRSTLGATEAGMLVDEVHRVDPSRPVTEATNPDNELLEPLLEHLNVVGYNYANGRYPADHAKHPDRVFIRTESFPSDAYGSWREVTQNSYAVGDFVWTALDYLGEAGIGRDIYAGDPGDFGGPYPYAVSGCGDLDITGVRKPQSYYRGILWNSGPATAAFVDAVPVGSPGYRVSGWGWPDDRESWTWPGSEGKTRTVRVYSRTPRAELFLNGKSLGIQNTNDSNHLTATYSVPYLPGELMAIGQAADGTEISRWTLKTAGPVAKMMVSPDRANLVADGEDLAYISVQMTDASGTLNPNATNAVKFALDGPGTIVAVANADPRTTEGYQTHTRSAFGGRLLVIVKTTNHAGKITLHATSKGLPDTQTVVISH